MTSSPPDASAVARLHEAHDRILDQLSRVIVGQHQVIEELLICLFNAGEEDDTHVPRMLAYADKHLGNISNNSFGHWHYAHFYYAQVMYREGGAKWESYRDQVAKRLLSEVSEGRDGLFWPQGYIGNVYTTATNLTILQLDRGALPIYQR